MSLTFMSAVCAGSIYHLFILPFAAFSGAYMCQSGTPSHDVQHAAGWLCAPAANNTLKLIFNPN